MRAWRRRALLAAAGAAAFGAAPAAGQQGWLGGGRRVVVIDPGHGGKDPGATGPGGLREKDIVLPIAEAIARRLEATTDAAAALTREADVFVALGDRVAVAEALGADLFVSIHADSAPDPAARGVSLYTLSAQASDALAASLAESQNAVDRIGGVALDEVDSATAGILIDLARDNARRRSVAVRRALLDALAPEVELLGNPARSANFAVLRSPEIPSLLVECGFLSNAEDAVRLREAAWREALAQRIADALSAAMPLLG